MRLMAGVTTSFSSFEENQLQNGRAALLHRNDGRHGSTGLANLHVFWKQRL
jgi:hypothetical protein